jgi:inorganic pyrophosphatase/exopolyphosphatase
MVIDHHDNPPSYPDSVAVNVDSVGSCSTLVFEAFNNVAMDPTAATLLLGAVVMDTFNLESERTTDRDRDAAMRLGLHSKMAADELFEEFCKKRFGRNGDSLERLLRRDSKQVECSEGTVVFSSITCPTNEVVEDEEFHSAVKSFLAEREASLCVMMFASLNEDAELTREIVLVQLEGMGDLAEGVAVQIEDSLQCRREERGGFLLIPTPSDVTRKKVLPIVVNLLNSQ